MREDGKPESFLLHVQHIHRDDMPWHVLEETLPDRASIEDVVLDEMPHGEGEEVVLQFFSIDHEMTCEEFAAWCLQLRYQADPYALAAAIRDDQNLPFEYPCASLWLDQAGKWCFLSFLGGAVRIEHAPERISAGRWYAAVCRKEQKDPCDPDI